MVGLFDLNAKANAGPVLLGIDVCLLPEHYLSNEALSLQRMLPEQRLHAVVLTGIKYNKQDSDLLDLKIFTWGKEIEFTVTCNDFVEKVSRAYQQSVL